jgi:hypothetical protein
MTIQKVTSALLVLLASAAAASLPYTETFDGPDGSPWPSPWIVGSSHVSVADLQANRARLNGDPAFVARMILPGFSAVDTEVLVTVEFEDVHNQGFGFYVRQNGGTLQEYLPHGQGYALFLKGNWYWPEDLGLWREIDGVETQFAWGNDPVAGGLQSDTRYRLRYRVTQDTPNTTLLQARVWPENEAEPAAWTIEAFDGQPELQNTAGSFAIDIYNYSGFGHIFIDDLEINEYPVPSSAEVIPPAGGFGLSAPRPHPVVGSATIDVTVEEDTEAEVFVFDVSGRLVARPSIGRLQEGTSAITWNPVDDHGQPLQTGVYFLRLVAGENDAMRRVVVLR